MVTLAAVLSTLPVFVAIGISVRIGTGFQRDPPSEAVYWFIAFALTVLLTFPAWAILQADMRRNPGLSKRARNWWLGALLTLPGSGVVYWLRHPNRRQSVGSGDPSD